MFQILLSALKVLQVHTGVSLYDTQKLGLDPFYYLDDFQAYYLIHSDTNVQPCTVISGMHVDDHQVKLEYTKTMVQTGALYFKSMTMDICLYPTYDLPTIKKRGL